MRWILLLLLCFPLAGLASLPEWSESVQRSWWQEHPVPADWVREADALKAELVVGQKKHGTSWAMRNVSFRKWLGHAWWLSLFPKNWETHPVFSRPEIQRAYRALALERDLPWRFLASLKPQDDQTAALGILCELAARDLPTCREYPTLAIATSVVWDQPLPDAWPHSFVARQHVPVGRETVLERFAFWVTSHRSGKLLLDPRRLSVNDLCFVVSTPLELKELAYAQRFQIKKPDQLWDLYRAVDYDHRRIKQETPTWNRGAYRLHTIWKEGGICADQAYLASSVFQSKGIPAILFLGQGNGGGHAWVGYRDTTGEWILNIARYKANNYPVGQAYHPQTRQRISDAELESFAGNLEQKASWNQTRIFLGWARMNADQPFYAELVRGARKLLPDLPETWEIEEQWLAENRVAPRVRAVFYQRWTDHFKDQPAMRFRGQKGLYKMFVDHRLTKEAEGLKETMLEETRAKRFDLGIHLAAEDIFKLVEDGDWKSAHKEFERTMSQFSSQAGGHLFYSLLEPYVRACIEDRQDKLARDAMKHSRRFNLSRTTILSNDIRELVVRVNGL